MHSGLRQVSRYLCHRWNIVQLPPTQVGPWQVSAGATGVTSAFAGTSEAGGAALGLTAAGESDADRFFEAGGAALGLTAAAG